MIEVVAADDPRAPAIAGRPLPEVDNVSAAFWAGVVAGKLLIQRCPQCSFAQFYPRALCTTCGGTPDWEEASGRGRVHTFTIIRQNWAEPFKGELPYIVAIIEIHEGPRMMSNITHCDIKSVDVGMDVVAYGVRVDDAIALLFWRPASSGTSLPAL